MRAALLLLPTALLLAACGSQKPAEQPKAEQAPPPPPSKATATKSVAFTCEGDMPITAIYGTDAEGNPDVTLIIAGSDQYDLHPTPAPHGTRYASARGAEVGKGVIWWEQDANTALLQQAPTAEVDNPDAGVTARTCHVKSEPDSPEKLRQQMQ